MGICEDRLMLAELLNIVLPVSQQKSEKTMSKIYVMQLFKNINSLQLVDTSYKLVDVDKLKIFLARNSTSSRQYVSDSNDCDDFALILLGDVTKWDSSLAFGIAFVVKEDGDYHALNVLIGTDKRVYFVEPQTDDVFLVPDGWVIRFVLM
jgi:hypothetical protein